MYLEKHILTSTNQHQNGALYCNAIDENPYDSTEWSNRMPTDSIAFDGGVVTYTEYFACYDGWDSHSYSETHNSMERAVASAWLAVYNQPTNSNNSNNNTKEAQCNL